MKKKGLIVLTVLLLLAGAAVTAIGVVQWLTTPGEIEISEYGMMAFYPGAFGYGTAIEEGTEQKTEAITIPYVEYSSEDGRFSFVREVSPEEYSDLEIARENDAEHRPVQRYVYTYFEDGEQKVIIQEQELNDNQLREIIGNSNRVPAWEYLIFAAVLVAAGGYTFWLAGRKPTPKPARKKAA